MVGLITIRANSSDNARTRHETQSRFDNTQAESKERLEDVRARFDGLDHRLNYVMWNKQDSIMVSVARFFWLKDESWHESSAGLRDNACYRKARQDSSKDGL